MCRQIMAVLLHMHSGFPAKMVEQMFMTSLNNVTSISCALEGGNYKKGSATKLEEFGCCYYCHLGVQAHVLGFLQSHRPSTLAVLVPLKLEAYPRSAVLFVLTNSMCPDLFRGL